MERRNKTDYYLDIAEVVCERGTCLRRKFGAIVVKDDEIISTGYTGAPRGRKNCCDRNSCLREELNIPKGEQYEKCRSVHAEANCIISAARRDLIGSTLYLCCCDVATGEIDGNVEPCSMCKRLIINAGIETVIVRVTKDTHKIIPVQQFIEQDDTTARSGY